MTASTALVEDTRCDRCGRELSPRQARLTVTEQVQRRTWRGIKVLVSEVVAVRHVTYCAPAGSGGQW